MTATSAVDERVHLHHDDDLDHWYCNCTPDIACCGIDISTLPEVDVFTHPCVVCEELVDLPCPRRGR